jgi:hypothetical protein
VLAAHALVLPAGVALLVLSLYLARRRRRALRCSVGLLGAIGGLELLKGLDVEETLISWGSRPCSCGGVTPSPSATSPGRCAPPSGGC